MKRYVSFPLLRGLVLRNELPFFWPFFGFVCVRLMMLCFYFSSVDSEPFALLRCFVPLGRRLQIHMYVIIFITLIIFCLFPPPDNVARQGGHELTTVPIIFTYHRSELRHSSTAPASPSLTLYNSLDQLHPNIHVLFEPSYSLHDLRGN